MYKIGEFSRIVSLTVKALRYYDEIKLLSPSRVDEENGYRYYDEECYKKATWIRIMKKYGFSLKEIQDVLPNIEETSDLAVYLFEKQQHLNDQIKTLRKLQKQIGSEVERLKEVEVMNSIQDVTLKTVPSIKVASVRYKGKYEDVGSYLGKLFKVVGMKGLSAPFSLYYDGEFTEENADIEVCIEIKSDLNKGDIKTRTLEEQKCVSIMHIGSYDTLSSSYKAIADYMTKNGLEGTTPSREIYLKGPGMLFKGNVNKYETEILIPVK